MTDNNNTPPPAGNPWHHGVDAGVLASWQNKGYDLTNPLATATRMWEQYSNAEKHLGVPTDQLLRLPKDVADAAGWDAVHQRLGAPKEAKDYDFTGVKFSDGTDLDDNFKTAMSAALHKAHVSKDAAGEVVKSVIKFFDDADAAETMAHKSKVEEQIGNLKKSWGLKHDENHLQAMQGARRLGIDKDTMDSLQNALGYDKIMEVFRRVGAGSTEDTFVEGKVVGNGIPSTAEGAKARLAELENDKAWVDRYMKGDIQARRESHALHEMITGVSAPMM